MIWAAFVLWLAAVDQSSARLGGTRESRRRSVCVGAPETD
jgi:hypothetical protein